MHVLRLQKKLSFSTIKIVFNHNHRWLRDWWTTWSIELMVECLQIMVNSKGRRRSSRICFKALLWLHLMVPQRSHKGCHFQLKRIKKKTNWRCGGSNPVPLACKASALPFELHPQLLVSVLKKFLDAKKLMLFQRCVWVQ